MRRPKRNTGAESRRFLFLGNQLALDFVNTEVMEHGQRMDGLHTPRDLAAWVVNAGLLEREGVAGWGGVSGARLLRRAKMLRAALRQMAEALASGGSLPSPVIPAINRELRRARSFRELVQTARGYEVQARSEQGGAGVLASIAQSAAELLAGLGRLRVRRCGNPACILYFYDTTRSHTRRWCSMAGCGNRMKVAAHYQRRRTGG